VRLGTKALLQCRSKPGLAETGLAGDQHDLAVAGFGTRPAAQHNIDFLIATDQRAERQPTQGLEPVGNGIVFQHLPNV
jgi:hypothetical protein